MTKLWTLLLLVIICEWSDESVDPCHSYTILYDDGSRSSKCDRYFHDRHDRFMVDGWRRVQLESTKEDLMMPEECVPHGHCGSHSSVWLNGSHPTTEDGIVNRTGCLSMFSSCCYTEYLIQIKNCSSFIVYNLKRTLGSDERYCFGESEHCFTKTPTTTKSDDEKRQVDDERNIDKRLNGHNESKNVNWQYSNKRHDMRCPHDKGGDLLLTTTIVLSVVTILLVIALIGTVVLMKNYYRSRVYNKEKANKIYGKENGGFY